MKKLVISVIAAVVCWQVGAAVERKGLRGDRPCQMPVNTGFDVD